MFLDLSREFTYNTGKVKVLKTKVRAPMGSGKGKKILPAFHLSTKLIWKSRNSKGKLGRRRDPEREKNLSAFHLLTKLIWTLCEGILDP